uniref:Uncharacterized protein n=1 Tax=Oryza barthii TaxID=65489 RepID=A0A0D3EVM8_9ORYZ
MKLCVEGIVDQGARGCTGDEDGDTIAAVVRKMTPKSRCSRTVKDETSHRTPGQLGTNPRAGVANTARATGDHHESYANLGDAVAMLEVEEEDPKRLTMTSADDEVVDARTAMKTTKAAKLRSERTTQLQLHVDAAARSPPVINAEEGASQHCNNQWRCGPQAAALRPEGGERSGTPKLDGVDACSLTIGCISRCSRALEQVIKLNMREAER